MSVIPNFVIESAYPPEILAAMDEARRLNPKIDPKLLTEDPPEGIHYDIPEEIYHRLWKKAVNKSSLDDIKTHNPKTCKHNRENHSPDTPALMVGKAVHTILMEPTLFDQRFVVATDCMTLIKSGANAGKPCGSGGKALVDGQWYCGKHVPPGIVAPMTMQVLTLEDMEMVRAMRESVMSIPDAKLFIEDAGHNEVSLVWIDKETGLKCKARVDLDRPNWDAFGDIKTTDHAAAEKFCYSITKYDYHRQGAFYLAGSEALGIGRKFFNFFAIEKPKPHGVGMYTLKDEDLLLGLVENRKLLRVYAECLSSGVWPSYNAQFVPIGISDGAKYKLVRDLADGSTL